MDAGIQNGLSFKDSQIKLLTDQNTKLINTIQSLEDRNSKLLAEKENYKEDVGRLTALNIDKDTRIQLMLQDTKNKDIILSESEAKYQFVCNQNKELLHLASKEEEKSLSFSKEKEELEAKNLTLTKKVSLLEQENVTNTNLIDLMKREKLDQISDTREMKEKNITLTKQLQEYKKRLDVELDSVTEQLRLRKQKQYSLLETINTLEDRNKDLESESFKIKGELEIVSKNYLDLREKLRFYETSEVNREEEKKEKRKTENKLCSEIESLRNSNSSLLRKNQFLEQAKEEHTIEIRNLSEKVFDFLEKVKIGDKCQAKLNNVIKKKDNEIHHLEKKLTRFVSKVNGLQRVVDDLTKSNDSKSSEIKALKTSVAGLNTRVSTELNEKLAVSSDNSKLRNENKSLVNRLEYLLKKMSNFEEIQNIDREKVRDIMNKNQALERKLEAEETKLKKLKQTKQVLADALRVQQFEKEKFEAQLRITKARHNNRLIEKKENYLGNINTTDKVFVKQANRYYEVVENYNGIAGLLMVVSSCRSSRTQEQAEQLLKDLNLPKLIASAQAAQNMKATFVREICAILDYVLGVKLTLNKTSSKLDALRIETQTLSKLEESNLEKCLKLEEAKRLTILRYVADKIEFKKPKGLFINLRSCQLGEEECHALCAVLKNFHPLSNKEGNFMRLKLNIDLSHNFIDDNAVKAFAPLLVGLDRLADIKFFYLDLQENQLSTSGIRYLTELLRGSKGIVRHVQVHSAGKIEALGTTIQNKDEVKVETLFTVDCRRNCNFSGVPEKVTIDLDKNRRKVVKKNVNIQIPKKDDTEDTTESKNKVRRNLELNQATSKLEQRKRNGK